MANFEELLKKIKLSNLFGKKGKTSASFFFALLYNIVTFSL